MKNLLLTLSLIFISTLSHALIITADSNIDSNNRITIDYAFQFEDADTDLAFIDLFFDGATFDNLVVSNNPSIDNWFIEVFQSAEDAFIGGLILDGAVSFENLFGPLTSGTRLTGFQISADFLGDFVPNSFIQAFDALDADFEPVGSAFETSEISVTQTEINAPLSSSIMLIGLTGLLIMRLRKTKQKG